MDMENMKSKIDGIQKKFDLGELSPQETIGELKKCLESEELCDDPIFKPVVKHMLFALDILKIIDDIFDENEKDTA